MRVAAAYIGSMELAHRYAFPDRFVSGAVGEPDRRVYFVQTRQGSRMTNVVCEQQQIKVLAAHLERVLAEVESVGGIVRERTGHRPRPHDCDPLDVPLDEDFRAGTMAISWQSATQSLRIELYALGVYRQLVRLSGDSTGDDVLEVTITLNQARDFIARTGKLLAAQAPTCPFCSQPIAPDGHLCPRSNGYRRPVLGLSN